MAEAVVAIGNEERELLRESVRGFLADHWPMAGAVERSVDTSAVARIWQGLAAQGLSKLGYDPDEGGLCEILLVFEELGRANCPAPLLGAVIVNLFARQQGGLFSELVGALHAGTAAAAIAFGAYDGDRAAGRIDATNGSINGHASFVEDAAVATHFVLFADTPSGIVVLPARHIASVIATPGLAVPALSDIAVSGATAAVTEAPATQLQGLAEVARLCYAARALGAAKRGFELACEHAKARKQFGQFIGQFQAIQHKLADCLTRLDGTQLTLDAAATSFDHKLPDWRVFAASALAYASQALRQVVLETHHTMGAIGYAEEHELPRHFRRIHADLVRFGGAAHARASLADYLLGPVDGN